MIEVAVAIIIDENAEEVLLAQRLDHQHQGGLWEFPGGKIEQGESLEEATIREIREELDIELLPPFTPLIRIEHDYGDKQVALDCLLVEAFSGSPRGMQGQKVFWQSIASLQNEQFPAANVPILTALKNLTQSRH